MKPLTSLALAAAIVVTAPGVISAQEKQQIRNRYGLTSLTAVYFLRVKSVQQDIKLSKEYVKKPQEMYDQCTQAIRNSRNLTTQERRKQSQEVRKIIDKTLDEILTTKQTARLVQISLQVRGGNALANAAVADELKLTEEQKAAMKKIRDDSRKASREASRARREAAGPGPLDGEALKKYVEEGRKIRAKEHKATTAKVMSLLTDEQKAKWKEMIGKPFKGEVFSFSPDTSSKGDDL